MIYVQRDLEGRVTGLFANAQPGLAEEGLPDDHPDVVAFQSVLLMAEFEAAIQEHIDTAARARRYRDGFALAGYVASTVPQYAAEAAAFVAWRDAVWLYAYGELDKAQNGQRPIPTVEDFISELPAMVWPS